jgi:hypothetical protein
MKSIKLSIVAVICLVIMNSVNASGYGYTVGNYSYFNTDSGVQYTSYSVGNFDYTYGSNGYSGHGYSVGNFYYWND